MYVPRFCSVLGGFYIPGKYTSDQGRDRTGRPVVVHTYLFWPKFSEQQERESKMDGVSRAPV
jgi:hypothetical protein